MSDPYRPVETEVSLEFARVRNALREFLKDAEILKSAKCDFQPGVGLDDFARAFDAARQQARTLAKRYVDLIDELKSGK